MLVSLFQCGDCFSRARAKTAAKILKQLKVLKVKAERRVKEDAGGKVK